MPQRHPVLLVAATVVAMLLTGLTPASTSLSSPAGAATPAFTVKPLHLVVHVGPKREKTCNVEADLYLPRSASRKRPVPALLTTNGYLGDKTSDTPLNTMFAERGYAVLAYSGLGWGGTGCRIYFNNPQYDGLAASGLVDFLAGKRGIAFLDSKHTQPFTMPRVLTRDRRDHRGTARSDDIRVGMFGASYGGGAQFAAASMDPRIDALIPVDTWHDLNYSLAPNHALPTNGTIRRAPGAMKTLWGAFLVGSGAAASPQSGATGEAGPLACPNMLNPVCPEVPISAAQGFPTSKMSAVLSASSVASFAKRIRVPTLLIQGQQDTLFDLSEAAATYRTLRAQGTPTKLIWMRPGHDSLTGAPGEYDSLAPNPDTQYVPARMLAWFDHHLRRLPVATGPRFAYLRPWITDYTGSAAPAFGTASSFPVGTLRTWHLSQGNRLTPGAPGISRATVLTGPAGLPTSTTDPGSLNLIADATGITLPAVPDLGAPGTSASWDSASLRSPLDVVGEPRLNLQITAPLALGAVGPAGAVVLFAKIYDVAPDGTATLINRQISPARIVDPSKPQTLVLASIVHRFPRGHRVRLSIAGGDLNFRGGLLPAPVTILTGSVKQRLSLPTVR